jgi:predicted homoserine dehydrogenase-like protein
MKIIQWAGMIGCGSMGKGLLYQSTLADDVKIVAISDCDLKKCIQAAEEFKLVYEIVDNPQKMIQAADRGVLSIVQNPYDITHCDFTEIFIEATSNVEEGCRYCEDAVQHGHNLVMMNSEVDLIHGPYLLKLAKEHKKTYTSCGGDQHGVLKELIDEVIGWGFEIVFACNMKGFLDRYANPTSIIPEADKRNLSYKMCTAYTDGTKLNIEMALLANAMNYVPAKPGMQGTRFKNLTDIELVRFTSTPVVDYVLETEPGGGVFVLATTGNKYQQEMMKYYKMGNGPLYLFHRPYHLCHVEAMKSIRNAGFGKPLLQPNYGFVTNVYAYAKKDLKAGDILDGIGGYACYGMIDKHNPDWLPICLADNLKLNKDVKQDSLIEIEFIENWDIHRSDISMYYKGLE